MRDGTDWPCPCRRELLFGRGESATDRVGGIKELQLAIECFDARNRHALLLCGAHGIAVDVFDLHRAMRFVVEPHAGLVGLHLIGVAQHFLDELVGDGRFARGDFAHERFDKSASVGVSHELGCRRAKDNGESIVRDIPDEFTPAGGPEVFDALGSNVGALEISGHRAKPVSHAVVVVAEADISVVEMANMTGSGLVGTEKAKAAGDAICSDDGGDFIFVAESVLHGNDEGVVLDDRRQERGEKMVLRGFKRDADDITARHIARVAVGVDAGKREVAVNGFADKAVLADVVVVGVQEKMNLQPGALEAGAVESAQGAGAEDGIGPIHGEIIAQDE